ncbi:bifunctional glutamate N-acetyltransferase/amino-acid acetyltransferase ArgJ [Leucobacter aridicollis]|uniref:bifunctional glutamate N-acetyltransferase/amino-acid acetyltransferase ArgJ n=1 Tax=Leucobacter aridicollis TaxID=283878 RepID=UPI0021060E61|nr:bifunctional glutamate N-acetyltransferase/amino-acid acetyltransferase ArgJ [Leucobacter aridicollis]UTX52192.1 bifunctional glutamate N-acetyltransferase/amino-acid acetyltransferase ArgJ [Leucobacter aridicollis]
MSVTYPLGFRSAGVTAGIKSSGKPDLALVVNDGPQPGCAVVFTRNRAQAHPIRWSRSVIAAGGTPRAVLLNSGGANCFTGEYGYETVELSAAAVAAEISGINATDVLVCSTGLIGSGGEEFRSSVLGGVPLACEALAATDESAPTAILTTDSVSKTATHTGAGWRIGAMGKGAGMLAPGLATMLVVITTDACVSNAVLDRALRAAVSATFNRLDSDGCMSTNDQVTAFASGASGVSPSEAEFSAGLLAVCDDIAEQLQVDAEGAGHNIHIFVEGAESESDAEEVGRALARNNLFKAAIAGDDPNWGRVLAAIGVTQASFDPYVVDVSFNGVRLCSAGGPDRPVSECDLSPKRTEVLIELHAGDSSARIRTNDLTVDYVRGNSAYAS